jgi:predicted nucleotidyltransferase component of viral defense system
MASDVFDQMLSRYEDSTNTRDAAREVMQQVALAGLHRAGFFEHAAFYGGTMLRIFHGLDRFSEDMDFSLIAPNASFDFERYTGRLADEFALIGREVQVVAKQKSNNSAILSAFLKDDTRLYDITGNLQPVLKIKLEIDTGPPGDFTTEYKLSLLPYSFMTRTYTLPSAFAGKMHALLFRNWGTRVKGRDWYDFEWYVRHGVALDLAHFNARAQQTGHIKEPADKNGFLALLTSRIDSVNFTQAKADVRPFVQNPAALDIWQASYFKQLATLIEFEG